MKAVPSIQEPNTFQIANHDPVLFCQIEAVQVGDNVNAQGAKILQRKIMKKKRY